MASNSTNPTTVAPPGDGASPAATNGASRRSAAPVRASPMLAPQDAFAGKPELPLNKPITVVGTADTCRLVLASRTISRHHAVFLVDGGTTFVADLASRTGVLVNGRAVHEAELKDGDRVQIGKFAFRYRTASVAPSRRSPPAPAASAVVAGLLAVALPRRVALVGRRETSDVALVGDKGVSAAHAALFHVGGQWYVRDLGSRTGTRVNGEEIVQKAITFGDRLGVGSATIQFEPAAAVPGHTPVPPSTLAATPSIPSASGLDDTAGEPVEEPIAADVPPLADELPTPLSMPAGVTVGLTPTTPSAAGPLITDLPPAFASLAPREPPTPQPVALEPTAVEASPGQVVGFVAASAEPAEPTEHLAPPPAADFHGLVNQPAPSPDEPGLVEVSPTADAADLLGDSAPGHAEPVPAPASLAGDALGLAAEPTPTHVGHGPVEVPPTADVFDLADEPPAPHGETAPVELPPAADVFDLADEPTPTHGEHEPLDLSPTAEVYGLAGGPTPAHAEFEPIELPPTPEVYGVVNQPEPTHAEPESVAPPAADAHVVVDEWPSTPVEPTSTHDHAEAMSPPEQVGPVDLGSDEAAASVSVPLGEAFATAEAAPAAESELAASETADPGPATRSAPKPAQLEPIPLADASAGPPSTAEATGDAGPDPTAPPAALAWDAFVAGEADRKAPADERAAMSDTPSGNFAAPAHTAWSPDADVATDELNSAHAPPPQSVDERLDDVHVTTSSPTEGPTAATLTAAELPTDASAAPAEVASTTGVAGRPAAADLMAEVSDFVFVPEQSTATAAVAPDEMFWGDADTAELAESSASFASPPVPMPTATDLEGPTESSASQTVPSAEAATEQLLDSGPIEPAFATDSPPANGHEPAAELALGDLHATPELMTSGLSGDFAAAGIGSSALPMHLNTAEPMPAVEPVGQVPGTSDATPEPIDLMPAMDGSHGLGPVAEVTNGNAVELLDLTASAGLGASMEMGDGVPVAPAELPAELGVAEPFAPEGLDPALAVTLADATAAEPPVERIAFDDLLDEPPPTVPAADDVTVDVGSIEPALAPHAPSDDAVGFGFELWPGDDAAVDHDLDDLELFEDEPTHAAVVNVLPAEPPGAADVAPTAAEPELDLGVVDAERAPPPLADLTAADVVPADLQSTATDDSYGTVDFGGDTSEIDGAAVAQNADEPEPEPSAVDRVSDLNALDFEEYGVADQSAEAPASASPAVDVEPPAPAGTAPDFGAVVNLLDTLAGGAAVTATEEQLHVAPPAAEVVSVDPALTPPSSAADPSAELPPTETPSPESYAVEAPAMDAVVAAELPSTEPALTSPSATAEPSVELPPAQPPSTAPTAVELPAIADVAAAEASVVPPATALPASDEDDLAFLDFGDESPAPAEPVSPTAEAGVSIPPIVNAGEIPVPSDATEEPPPPTEAGAGGTTATVAVDWPGATTTTVTSEPATAVAPAAEPATPPFAPRRSTPTAFGFSFEGGSFLGGMPLQLNGPSASLPPTGITFDNPVAEAPAIAPVPAAAEAIAPAPAAPAAEEPPTPARVRPPTPPAPAGEPLGLTGPVSGTAVDPATVVQSTAVPPPPIPPIGLVGLAGAAAARPSAGPNGRARTAEVFSQMAGPIGVEAFATRPRQADQYYIPEVDRSAPTAPGQSPPGEPPVAARADAMVPPPATGSYQAGVAAQLGAARRRRRSKVRKLAAAAVVFPLLWVAGVYMYVQKQVVVVGTIEYDGLSRLGESDRRKFYGDQVSTLCSEDVRQLASQTLHTAGQPLGLTEDSISMDQAVRNESNAFQLLHREGGRNDALQFTYVAREKDAAVAQVRALLAALRVKDLGLDDARATAQQQLDKSKADATAARAAVEAIKRDLDAQRTLAQDKPDRATLEGLDAASTSAAKRLADLTADRDATQAGLDQLRQQDPTKPIDVDVDPQVVAIRKGLDPINAQIAKAKELAGLASGAATRPGAGGDDDDPLLTLLQGQASARQALLDKRLAELAAVGKLPPAERARARDADVEAASVKLADLAKAVDAADATATKAAADLAAAQAKAVAAAGADARVQQLIYDESEANNKLRDATGDLADKQRAMDASVIVAGSPEVNPSVSAPPELSSDPRPATAAVGAGVIAVLLIFWLMSVAGAPAPGEEDEDGGGDAPDADEPVGADAEQQHHPVGV
jgi:pSer/pThr/pTyr-binding forkhead associated (FHA) protein